MILQRFLFASIIAAAIAWTPTAAAAGSAKHAVSPYVLSHDQPAAKLSRHAAYYEDRTGSRQIDDARDLAASGYFHAVDTDVIDFNLSRSFFWILVVLQNGEADSGVWRLDLNIRSVTEGDIYVVRGERTERIFHEGPETSFGDRPIQYRHIAADVPLDPGETVEVYIRYRRMTTTMMPLTVVSPKRFHENHDVADALRWIFYGVLLALAGTSVAFSSAMGGRLGISFALYLLALALWCFHMDGAAFQHFWPQAPIWNDIAVKPLGLLMVVFGAVFVRVFFQTDRRHPRLDVIFRVMIAGSLMLAVLSVFNQSRTMIVLVYFIEMLAAQLYFAAGVIGVRAGRSGAAYFLAGATAVLASALFSIYVHSSKGAVPMDLTLDTGRIAFLIEAIAFTGALMTRIWALRRDRDNKASEAIKTLEEKLALQEELIVAERRFSRAWRLAESRQQMLTHASHDLGQPLASLRLALSRLRIEGGDATDLRRQVDYLESLVNRYLDTPTDSDAGSASSDEPHPEDFPVSIVIDGVARMHREEAQSKGIKFRTRICTAIVRGNPLATMRALSNLTANAVKHTRSGSIIVGARRLGEIVYVEVRDTGPGMSKQQLARAMEPYVRGAGSKGRGLGLSIVRELSLMHGFSFTIANRKRGGLCAAIGLPLAAGDRASWMR